MNPTTFFHIAAFFSGMAIMGVEVSASRLLAPYFGSSMITWTILIGIILTAMSLGSRFGGRLADSCDRPDRLFRLLFWCAIWVALTPWLGRYLMTAALFGMIVAVPGQALPLGVLLSCLLIFAPPCFVLGMVSPFLLRFTLPDTAATGRTAGDLGALSTVGSIFGTFLPTFVSIPYLGSTRTFLLFAAVLGLISLAYFRLVSPESNRAGSGSLLVVLMLCALPVLPLRPSFAFWTASILEDESVYNYLRVAREYGGLQLSTHTLIGRQSIARDDGVMTGNYWDYAMLAPFFRDNPRFEKPLRLLVLGYGAGTISRICRFFFPASTITGVEIDPAIAALGSVYFGVKPGQDEVVIEDARTFLTRTERTWDMVVLDAYHDISIPFHLTTAEFWYQVKSRLASDGVVAVNYNLPFAADLELSESLVQTMKSVFPRVFVCPVRNEVNSIFIATMAKDSRLPDPMHAQVGEDHILYPVFKAFLAQHREIVDTAKILTDDFAPVEWLSNRALGNVIRDGIAIAKVRAIHALRTL
ncbi:MAG TPA: fused MFS/spermidine synthase [Candidatus Ozemobacteraceae bacterium]|nr:fused MFS/spermidine synthase [Candidatus Ozemobacteraceae bacterium]